jgi:integrase
MDKLELNNNNVMENWSILLDDPSKTYWDNCVRVMQHYTEFTTQTPEELIDEAKKELKKGLLDSERTLYLQLPKFEKYLRSKVNSKSERTISTYMGCIKSFYLYNGINIPKSPKKKKRISGISENSKIPTMEDIRQALPHCSVRDKAVILCGISSGMGASEISNLKLQTFYDGLDKKTMITTLRVRRQKTDTDYITFLSPEATDAVLEYLRWRDRPTKYTAEVEINRMKKRATTPESYLFIMEKIDDSYLETGDEEIRKYKPTAMNYKYMDISNNSGLDAQGKGIYNIIRSHNMRKIFNSTLKMNGCNNLIVEYMMGHVIDATQSAYFFDTNHMTQDMIDKMKEQYAKYVPYLIVQKELALVDNPEFKRTEEEIAKLKAENELLVVERSEFTKQNERIRLLEERNAIHNALDILRGKKVVDEDGEEIVYNDDNEVMNFLKLYLDEGEEGIMKRDIEMYGEDFVQEIEAEMEAEGVEENIRRKYKPNTSTE